MSFAVGLTSLSVAAAGGGMSRSGWWAGVGLGLAIVAVLPAVGMATRSAVNFSTRNLGVNVITYFVPLLTILLLVATGRSGEITLWLAISGGLVIAVANIALARPGSQRATPSIGALLI